MQQLNEWVCTDPDNNQYGIKVKDGHYRFKEFDRFNYTTDSEHYPDKDLFISTVWDNDEFWIEVDIVLAHYTNEQIANHISAYYNNLDQLKEIYGEDSEWIIAECIFEQESGLY